MRGRIALHLDKGLGWTAPWFVAGCGDCGTELARSTDQAAARLQVSAKTVSRWANQGRLQHRRTLGGHRRFDPELIDALVQALTYRP